MRCAPALALLAAAALLTGCGGRPPATAPAAHPPNAVVATVDGAPIDLGEFRLTLDKDESAAYQYFEQTSGIRDSAGFWTTPVRGTRPIDWLKQRALTDAVQDKVTELLGAQRHIATVLDYAALVANLDAENQRRRIAVGKNQPVYGPQQFDLAEYYDLWLSNLKMRIIDTMPSDAGYAALLAGAVGKAAVHVNRPVYDLVDPTDLGT